MVAGALLDRLRRYVENDKPYVALFVTMAELALMYKGPPLHRNLEQTRM